MVNFSFQVLACGSDSNLENLGKFGFGPVVHRSGKAWLSITPFATIAAQGFNRSMVVRDEQDAIKAY